MTFDDDGPRAGAGALPRVHGSGGGSSKGGSGAASSAPDTLFSTATVRLVDLLGEGEIVGVRGGLKGVYLNDVPVQNADGSFNFKGLTAEFRIGTPDQPYMAGYPDVQTPNNVGIKVNQATPVTVSISDTDVDRLRVTIQVPSLFLAKSDGSVRANSVSYRIQARYSGGPWVNALGDQTITGKTTSGYFRSHEIALPINPSGASAPWQVQVIRLSPDTDDFNNSQAKFTNQSDLVFHSTTSIVDARFGYPHSAMVGLTAQASSFGSSVPGRTYLVDGVLMPIPSNYDPVARTYSGVWDGTFKEGFSNNPAWALNLVLRNDRFGLGEFIDVAAIDKWSLYEIGRYCDVPVSDGKGGQEPRYVFNGAISTQQEAFELLQLIAQVFRGTVYWSSGTVTAAQDRPADPVLLVTEANVIDGEFSYASSGRRARNTVAIVAWNDPDNLYKQAIEVVEDAEGVARYGYNPTKIDLLGCTSRGQAHRTGLWTLFTELHQTQVLTYRAGLDHAVIRPGDIVAVQDPQIANLDLSGRLMGDSTASVLVLDRPVTLASGAAYSVSVVMPDGTVQEREISTGAGTVSSVTLRSALPQVPDPATVWLIAGPIEPQLFRVVSIREEEPHIYAVSALQHEPGKYAAIDDGAAFEPSVVSDFPSIVLPPTDLSVRESQYTELGQPKQAITLSWLAGQPFNSVAYFVTVIRPSGATVTTRTASQSIDFMDAEVGDWTFVVTAIGLNGKHSLPSQTTYTLAGWAGQAATTVAGLSVKGGGSIFSGRSCTVTWDNLIAPTVTPYPVRNAVYIFDASTHALVHREVLPAGVTEWTYDYFLNVNEGGPRRQFRVGVTAYSAAGDEGPPSYLTVSNPAPEIIVPTLGATSEVLFVDLPKVADADFAGYLVWVSETPNINPLTAPSYDVAGNSFPYRGVPDKTYYVRAAAYDAFSKDPAQLNVSAEQSKKLTIQLFDPLAPPIPGTPTLASNVAEIAPDGAVTAKVTIQWPAVTSTNLATYEVAIAEGNNPAQAAYVGGRFVSGTTAAFAGLMPGRQYSFKVRSNPLNGLADSGWSPILVVTAALNTTPPSAPTAFTAAPSFEAANLAWTNPTNKDLLGVEVWAGTTNALANATLLKTVPAPAAFYRDVLGTTATKFYWIRAVNTSDFKSGFVGSLSVTSGALLAAQIGTGIIDETKIASSLALNKNVASLPATKGTDYVTFNGEQYRWDAAAGRYTKAVSAADISGKVAAAQIDTINAAQIVGTVAAAQIAAVEASKITGALTSAQIASLDAAKIFGKVAAAQIDTINATQIAGQVQAAQIASIAAGQVTGQLSDTQLAGISAAKIGGQITSDQIVSLTAAKLAGQITSTQITDNAITTAKIGAGQVLAGNIAAGAVTTSKLTVASGNLIFNSDLTQGLSGYRLGYKTHSLTANITINRIFGHAGRAAVKVTVFGTPAVNQVQFVELFRVNSDGTTIESFPVDQNRWYEFSAYVNVYRALRGCVYINWYNSAGDHIDQSEGNYVNTASVSGPLVQSQRSVIIRQAPPGAAYVYLYFVATYNGTEGAPDVYFTAPMFAMAQPNQTEASPYVTGEVTSINGGTIITGTLSATKIVAESITTSQIAAGGIHADRIVANSIWTNQIQAGGIHADRLVAQSVTAGQIAGSTITGDKIAGRTISAGNIVAGTLTGNEIQANSITANEIAANAITTPQISAGAVVTSHMTAGSINADRLVAQSITAGLIAGSTITGDKIAGRTISAGNVVTGTLTGNEIQANSVNADRLVANSITAAKIAAGAIGANQIAANAIQASKLLMSTKNMINNSDMASGIWNYSLGYQSHGVANVLMIWGSIFGVGAPMRSVQTSVPGKPANDTVQFIGFYRTYADGSRTEAWDIAGSQIYEFSIYGNVYRGKGFVCALRFQNADGSQSQDFNGNFVAGYEYGATLKPSRRSFVIAQAPSWATKCYLMAWSTFNGTESNPDSYFSAPMFAVAQAGQTEPSPYVSGDITAIDGGIVITNTLHANRIIAGTITTDRVATGGLHADRIQAGTITTTQIQAGGINADRIQARTITSTQIAANSISASRMVIEARGIMPVNVYFEMERDGNGTPTGWLKWSGGQIEWIDDNGSRAFSGVPGGRMNRGSDGWVTVWFDKTAPGQLWANAGNNIPAIRANPNLVLVATSADFTGVIVNWGGTVIDGDKIVANSIQARNIAANQIQTVHMAANSISGDRIQTGTLSADKITTGTLTVSSVFSLGANSQTDIYADPGGGTFRVRSRNLDQWRAAFGYIGPWTGDGNDFGLLLWGTDGVNRVRFSNAVNFIDGVVISDATIQNAKIANLTIGNEKVQNDAITNGAASIGGAFQRDREVYLNIRRAGTRVGIWVSRTGNPSTQSTAQSSPGLLRTLVARPGQGWADIRQIPNCFTFEYYNGLGNGLRHMPTMDMSHYTCDTAGTWGFRVIDDSNADSSASSIIVIEFSK